MEPNIIYEKFAAFLKDLENWKAVYPYIETYRMELPGPQQRIPPFQLPPSETVSQLLYRCITWLEQYIVNNDDFNEEQKANFVYTVFDHLDLNLLRSGTKYLLVSKDYDFFVNPFRYWKTNSEPRPLSSSTRSFETFGLCKWNDHSHHIVLSELVEGRGDPLRVIRKLNLGLFPLSEKWNIKWKYTKVLNPERKTHGIIAEDTTHENREMELLDLTKIIRDNKLHVAFFPELMLRKKDVKYLWDLLVSDYIDLHKLPFFLLVGGSFHVPNNGNFINEISLIIRCFGKTFSFSYAKLEPFYDRFDKMIPRRESGVFDFTHHPDWESLHNSLENSSIMEEFGYEDIEHDPGITIIETEGFGKFGFAICKDVLPDQSKILRQYGNMIDHLVVISLNASKKADFGTIAGQLALKRNIATYYVNARRYDPDLVTPSFIIDFQMNRSGTEITKTQIGQSEEFIIASLNAKGIPSRRTI
jgi:hypothetical protein